VETSTSRDWSAAIHAVVEPLVPQVLELTTEIAQVAAPTGEEMARSRHVTNLLPRLGLTEKETDELGNVVATLRGRRSDGPAVLLAAHLDTVFPATTVLDVRHENGRLHGPGVGDNSLGIAAMLMLPRIFHAVGVEPAVDVLLAANIGEEGLGNLRGMRAVMDAHPRIAAAVAVEGHNVGRVTHIAVGSRRLRVVFHGPGGHSWGDAGRPSAVHVLAQIVSELSSLPLPRSPKVSLNVGTFQGGVSVNTIAPTATCLVDLRSVDDAALRRLTERVERIIGSANRGGVRVEVDVMGDRPAGVVSLDSEIVQMATAILGALRVDVAFDASSTDANIPISKGIPSVCIGLSRGGNVHRVDEYIEIELISTGLAQLALLSLALADDSRTA